MDPLPGDRVVVRYRLNSGGPDDWRATANPALSRTPSLSDLTGVLIDDDGAALVVERDGAAERIPHAAITSVRQLSRRVVRNSQIREVERALTAATPAAERVVLDGWTVSADPGSTALRANAAVPLEFGASAAALDRVRGWYADRGRPALVVVPERLLRTAEVSPRPGAEYEVLVGARPSGGSRLRSIIEGGAPTEGDEPAEGGTPDEERGPVEVAAADRAARIEWRARGYELHHTFVVADLSALG